MLVTERGDARLHARGRHFATEERHQAVAQLVDVEIAGVDDEVGLGLHGFEEEPLSLDRVGHGAGLVGKGVPAPGAAVAAHEHVGRRVEEQDAHAVPSGPQLREGRQHITGVRATTHDEGDPADARARRTGELRDGRDERGGQVVDDEPAEILERQGGLGATGPGQARDHEELTHMLMVPTTFASTRLLRTKEQQARDGRGGRVLRARARGSLRAAPVPPSGGSRDPPLPSR